jgi:peptidoglycan/LPS O-acetylase OafA/YrhL
MDSLSHFGKVLKVMTFFSFRRSHAERRKLSNHERDNILTTVRLISKLGGSVTWHEACPPPIKGIDQAISLGFAETDDGSGWNAHCGVKLTSAGRELLLDPPKWPSKSSKQPSTTLGSVMAGAGGATSGFDYLRIALAVSVLVFHSAVSTYGNDSFLWERPWRAVVSIILPMFFSLSGFLVAGSYFRSASLREFITARFFRIFPALAVETILSALILGAAFSAFPLHDYFSDRLFFRYFMNLFGNVQFFLPGVFEDNPLPRIVNQSLWTVPYELECYVALTIAAVVGAIRYPKFFASAVFLLIFMLIAYNTVMGRLTIGRIEPRLLVVSFLVGVTLYVWRERIPSSPPLAIFTLVVSVATLEMTNAIYYFSPIPIAYLTVWLGLRSLPPSWIVSSGDYSYGIYLYAFPFQQTYVLLFPEHRVWWLNVAFALSSSFIFAIMSWKWIEKPFLKLRHSRIAKISWRGETRR